MCINLPLFTRNRKLEDDAIPTENLYPGKKNHFRNSYTELDF